MNYEVLIRDNNGVMRKVTPVKHTEFSIDTDDGCVLCFRTEAKMYEVYEEVEGESTKRLTSMKICGTCAQKYIDEDNANADS